MEWSSIATIVLGSSLLGAALTNAVAWFLKSKERSRQASYLALNVAHAFEQYAYVCLSAVEGHDTAGDSDGQVGNFLTKLPEFRKLPDFDYRDFDLEILDRVFDFPQRVLFADENLSFAFDVLDGEDAVKEGYKSCLQLAQEALSIAAIARARYNLEKRDLRFGEYSLRERLNEKLQGAHL